MENNKPIQINVEDVIASKNKKLAKRLPGFVIRFIKRTIHEDEINRVLREYANDYGIDFIKAVLNDFGVSFTAHGIENIPKDGRYIFASNHPLGGFDGNILINSVYENFGEPRFIVNDLLLFVKNFNPLFVPINKHGSQGRASFEKIEAAYSSDYPILIFPAGLNSRKIKGKIIDLEWKKSFVVKAKQYQRDIVPVFFDATNSKRFYRIANWRKFFRIKANIEMFYLPDEMFHQKGNHYNIYFGKPISYKSLDNSKKPTEWAEHIKKIVYGLKKD